MRTLKPKIIIMEPKHILVYSELELDTNKLYRDIMRKKLLQNNEFALKFLERRKVNKLEQHEKVKRYMNKNLNSNLYL